MSTLYRFETAISLLSHIDLGGRYDSAADRQGIAAPQKDPEYHHGPALLGFEKDNRRLIEKDNYQRVCAMLDVVAQDEMNSRKSATELDTSRRTIHRTLKKLGLYGVK